MRTFAEKPKATQQVNSPRATVRTPSHFGHSHEVNSILHLQRTIGNQAVKRLLWSNDEEFATFRPHPAGADAGRSPRVATNADGNAVLARQIARGSASSAMPQRRIATNAGGNMVLARQIARGSAMLQRRSPNAHVGGEAGHYEFLHQPGGGPGDTLAPGDAGYSRQLLSETDDRAEALTGNYADAQIRQVAPATATMQEQIATRAREAAEQQDKTSSWWGEDVSWNRSYREAAQWCRDHAGQIREDGRQEDAKIAQYNAWVPRANGFFTSLTRLEAMQNALGATDPRSMATALIQGLHEAEGVAARAQLAHDRGQGETLDVPAADDTVVESADQTTLAAREMMTAYLGFQQLALADERAAVEAEGTADRTRLQQINEVKQFVRQVGGAIDTTMSVVSGAPAVIANARSALIHGEASLNAARNRRQILAGERPTHNPTYVTVNDEGEMIIRNVQTGRDRPAAGGESTPMGAAPSISLPTSIEGALGAITDFAYYDEVREINMRLEAIKTRCAAVEHAAELAEIARKASAFQDKLNAFAQTTSAMQSRLQQRRQAYLEFGVQLDNFARRDEASRRAGVSPAANAERFATIMTATSAVREVVAVGRGALEGFDTPRQIATWAQNIVTRRRASPPRTDISLLSVPDDEWAPLNSMYGQTSRMHTNISRVTELFASVEGSAASMISGAHQGGGSGAY